MVSLCKPVIQKLKILGGGKLKYYKPMRGTTKRRDQILKFQWGRGGEQKRGRQFLTQTWWVEISWKKLWFIFGRIYTKNIYTNYI